MRIIKRPVISRGGLAYMDFDGSTALAASETTLLEQPLPRRIIEFHCHNVIEAPQLIAEWADL